MGLENPLSTPASPPVSLETWGVIRADLPKTGLHQSASDSLPSVLALPPWQKGSNNLHLEDLPLNLREQLKQHDQQKDHSVLIFHQQ